MPPFQRFFRYGSAILCFFFLTWHPKDTTISAILKVRSLGCITILLTVPSVGILGTCVLFLTSNHSIYVLRLFITANTVLSGKFNGLCIFRTHYSTCDCQLPSVSSELTMFFPCWWLTKGICILIALCLYASEQKVMMQYSFWLGLTKLNISLCLILFI